VEKAVKRISPKGEENRIDDVSQANADNAEKAEN